MSLPASIKKIIKPAVMRLKPVLESIFQLESKISRFWAGSAHKRLMFVQWALPPQPECFDHHIDLYYYWLASRNPLWVERGVFGSLALKGGDVLELACGDGFNARNFYSLRSKEVIACDFDPKAIKTARKKNSAPNVKFLLADIRKDMPRGKFENIVWDAAIEHFTPGEINKLMAEIKNRLVAGGILSGYTIVERKEGKSLSHHEYEFKDKQDLLRFLTPYFKHVTVFETIYPSRHNLYFWASDGTLPFRDGWSFMATEHING
ncbi:MAG: class I SAM-dependent methyltransferase [Patescibacteria group bacterium]|nr:class I SAM-dependent methyltransferase [Patescibacteria group bacterium]